MHVGKSEFFFFDTSTLSNSQSKSKLCKLLTNKNFNAF